MCFVSLFVLWPLLSTVLAWWVFCAVYAVVQFALYIFRSFGLLRIARTEQDKCPYIVWIPVASDYVLGRYCLRKTQSVLYTVLAAVRLSLWISLAVFRTIAVSRILAIYTAFYFIIDMIVMSRFYKKVYKTPELFTVLTIITLGLTKPVFLYTARFKRITKVDLRG